MVPRTIALAKPGMRERYPSALVIDKSAAASAVYDLGSSSRRQVFVLFRTRTRNSSQANHMSIGIDLSLLHYSLSPMLRNIFIRSAQSTAYSYRNMSSFAQSMPVVACGRIPAMGKSISQHLLPEYEGS